ncbi:hypothetical protein DV736_g1928, partial [Chaetothyriales sp. CBS 134916]
MALSFFHGDQLVRGAAAAEIEQPALPSRTLSDEGGKGQRPLPHTIRKLHSETALGAQARAEETSLRRHSFAREDKGKEPLRPESRGRPVTLYSYHSDSSESLPVEVSRGRPMAILSVRKPSFLNVRSNSTKVSTVEPERPKSSGNQRMSWKKKEPFKPRLHEEFSIEQRVSIQAETPARERPDPSKRTSASRGNTTVRESGGGVGGARSSHSVKQNPPRLFVPPKDTIRPAQFLAESLAHVIVGEWLYKDPHKPGLMPQANILQRHLGPPPRGSTGLPQKRWFRIDPYERLLTWSSKWDSTASARHKARRRVPIKLVFEVSNRLVVDGCIPAHAMPHNESIVVVAPLQVLKITAPDETRHALWMTALQYLVDSKNIPAHAWPDVLATRLSPLSSVGAAGTRAMVIRPSLLPVPIRTPVGTLGAAAQAASADPVVVVGSSSSIPSTRPNIIYGHDTASRAALLAPRTARFRRPAVRVQERRVSGQSVAQHEEHEHAEMYASSSERQPPGQLLQPYEHQHREHRPQEQEVATVTDDGSDDYEVDQMDELVAGLGNI